MSFVNKSLEVEFNQQRVWFLFLKLRKKKLEGEGRRVREKRVCGEQGWGKKGIKKGKRKIWLFMKMVIFSSSFTFNFLFCLGCRNPYTTWVT
jgi:hypothetical protein